MHPTKKGSVSTVKKVTSFDSLPSISRMVKKAFSQPDRIIPFLKRFLRNQRIRSNSGNFLEFYSQVVDHNAARVGAAYAIGSLTPEGWLEIGKFEFDFLVSHGLRPSHRFLDIGCGNLRLGAQLIPYLERQMYVGIDISPRIISAAYETIKAYELQLKMPYIFFVSGTNYTFLPENHFDAVHAHSVFSHLPLDEIEKVLRQAFRVLKPGGWFDFTYFNREKSSKHLDEDFGYPSTVMIELACQIGFQAQEMKDWVYIQEKIRATKPL